MQPEGAIAATPYWKPRLARAAGWAVVGAASFLLGWWAIEWLASLDLDLNVSWTVGPIEVGLLILILGFVYSGALGVAMWRAGHAGWWHAACFAFLAMFWFDFGFNAGATVYLDISGLPDFLEDFLAWFAGLLTAGVWVTLAGLLLLPVLRSRRAVAWLLGASAGFAALAGAIAMVQYSDLLDDMQYVVTAWCAVYAAALSMALPQPQRNGGGSGGP